MCHLLSLFACPAALSCPGLNHVSLSQKALSRCTQSVSPNLVGPSHDPLAPVGLDQQLLLLVNNFLDPTFLLLSNYTAAHNPIALRTEWLHASIQVDVLAHVLHVTSCTVCSITHHYGLACNV